MIVRNAQQVRQMSMPICGESPAALLLEGTAQFNRGEHFEQHETWEVWRTERRDVRRLYQGICRLASRSTTFGGRINTATVCMLNFPRIVPR